MSEDGGGLKRPRQPIWHSLVAVVASTILLSLAGIWYTHRATAESERKWCQLLTLLDDAYSATPPRTETGRQVAAAMHTLRVQFGC